MKKIEVRRESNDPVNPEHIKKFNEEFMEEYDKIWAEHKSDMVIVAKMADELEARLFEKYPAVDLWDWKTSKKHWKELTTEHGPIAIASNAETGELAFLIMDKTFS